MQRCSSVTNIFSFVGIGDRKFLEDRGTVSRELDGMKRDSEEDDGFSLVMLTQINVPAGLRVEKRRACS